MENIVGKTIKNNKMNNNVLQKKTINSLKKNTKRKT